MSDEISPNDRQHIQQMLAEDSRALQSIGRENHRSLVDDMSTYCLSWRQALDDGGYALENTSHGFTYRMGSFMAAASNLLNRASQVTPVGKRELEYLGNLACLKAIDVTFGLILEEDFKMHQISNRMPETEHFDAYQGLAKELGLKTIVSIMNFVTANRPRPAVMSATTVALPSYSTP